MEKERTIFKLFKFDNAIILTNVIYLFIYLFKF